MQGSKTTERRDPIVDCASRAVEARGLRAFFASEAEHGTQPLRGESPRIVHRFGFAVPPDYRLADHASERQ